jgi:hypothetical protein
MREVAALVSGLLFGGAAAAPAWGQQLSDEAALAKLRGEILQLIGEAPCANLVHCRAVALGWKPCGGPSEYLAYGTVNGKGDLIQAKATEYSILYEDVERTKGASGACVVLPPPRVGCVDNHCRVDSGRQR